MDQITLWWGLVGDGFLASLVVGLVLPLVGALIYLRRSAFLGVAVPQFSAAGLALGLWMMPWFAPVYEEFLDHGHPPMAYLFLFAVGAAALSLWGFALVSARHSLGSADSRLASGFAAASAFALLFLNMSPAGANVAETILRGEVLYLDTHGLVSLGIVFLVVLLGLVRWRRAFLLVAFDPEAAVALGHRVARYERRQILLVGLAIGGGVMTVGPVLVFGLLFLPPLAARRVANTMRAFLLHVVLVGLLSVFGAWPLSIAMDQPYGPTTVVLSTVLVLCYQVIGVLRTSRLRA